MNTDTKKDVVMKNNKLIAVALLLLSIFLGFSTVSFASEDNLQEAMLKLQNKATECREAGNQRCVVMCNRAQVEGNRNALSEKFKALSQACHAANG